MNINFDIEKIDWQKQNGLVPAIIQDHLSSQVLMLGFMNKEALIQTLALQKVVFYSRTKKRLWMKGETSGNCLNLIKIFPDCDNDSLLILVSPHGQTCHTGSKSCFNHTLKPLGFNLDTLEKIIANRFSEKPENSYTTRLFESGLQRIAQKVGEEAVETILAAVAQNRNGIILESADLIYHWLVLLRICNISVEEIIDELKKRTSIG